MGTPNWGNLVQQGRAKDIGVPWSQDEINAVYVLKVPVEYVRRGCLTIEDYEALKKKDETHESKTGELPLEAMSRAELLRKATNEEVSFTSDAPDSTLRALLKPFEKKPAKKKEAKKTKK